LIRGWGWPLSGVEVERLIFVFFELAIWIIMYVKQWMAVKSEERKLT